MPEDFVPQRQPPSPHAAPTLAAPYPAAMRARSTAGFGAPPPRRRSAWFYIASIGGSVAAVVLVLWLFIWATMRSTSDTSPPAASPPASIGVIDISGVILDAEKVDTQLRKFGEDSSVKAIILHINSPGGGAAASQEIYHEVLRVRQENHKKIVASVECVGASGAYYIASACDRIYANDASVVGSIGVIMEWTNYGDLLRWAKLKNIVIHAGELKDAGDPSRDLTPKEAAYFQSLVDNMYGSSSTTSPSAATPPTTRSGPSPPARSGPAQQSLPLGLIDKSRRLPRRPHRHRPRRRHLRRALHRPPSQPEAGLLGLLNSDADDLFPNPSKLLDRAPGFYFMWK